MLNPARLAKVVTCPRCGLAVWEPRLETEGCPTCRIIDTRAVALPLDRGEATQEEAGKTGR